MRILKRNQIVILVIALLLISAGYMNFTNKNINNDVPVYSSNLIAEDTNLGDATLVSSVSIVENEVVNNNIEGTDKENIEKQEDNYFSISKLERDTMYSQMLESYQKMFESNSVTAEQKGIAATEIDKINKQKNSIMIAENLIKTKGFEDVIIFINDMSISVIVKSDSLTTEKIAQIQNIIARELSAEVQNIHISNR